jgi:hypothetical protein
MKKFILFGIVAAFVSSVADARTYTETETRTVWESYTYTAPSSTRRSVVRPITQKPIVKSRPVARRATCTKQCGEPVRVKTHTEVIDHYQIYQPVTQYVPAGTYATRRIIETPKKCGKCAI